MAALIVILICAIVKNVLAGSDLLNPCEIKDMACLSKTTQDFLNKTSSGFPQFDIKPIDPLTIPELTYEVPDLKIVFHFKNLTVTGLKEQKITDFQLDKTQKSVVLQTKVDDANIVSDVRIELKSKAKSFIGTYRAKTSVIGTATYNYELIPNKDGVEFFDVGPEKVTCVVLSEPEVTLDPELANIIATDPDAVAQNAQYTQKASEIRKDVMAKIFEKAYTTVIHNIRAVAKVSPKELFFKDI